MRIRSILKDYPEVLFDVSEVGDFFRVELTAASVKNENLPETQKHIIENMLKNFKVTYDEPADITGRTRETIRVHVNKLKEMGIIKRFGPDKGGHRHVTLHENREQD